MRCRKFTSKRKPKARSRFWAGLLRLRTSWLFWGFHPFFASGVKPLKYYYSSILLREKYLHDPSFFLFLKHFCFVILPPWSTEDKRSGAYLSADRGSLILPSSFAYSFVESKDYSLNKGFLDDARNDKKKNTITYSSWWPAYALRATARLFWLLDK